MRRRDAPQKLKTTLNTKKKMYQEIIKSIIGYKPPLEYTQAISQPDGYFSLSWYR